MELTERELREKVVAGLAACMPQTEADAATSCSGGCPYFENPCGGDYQDNDHVNLPIRLIEDVRKLLKAQEPRVMTLEEVNALDWDYCYLEQERLPGKEYRGMLGKYIITCVTWPSVTAAKISQGKDNYGRTWRCWTSRPTDEVRRATPWN